MPITVRRLIFLALLLVLSLDGCAGSGSSAAPATPTPRSSAIGAVAPPPVALADRVVSTLQGAFAKSDWSAVSQLFVDRAAGGALVSRMQQWKDEHVRSLRVDATYVHRIAANQYAVTLKFSDDPRAVPVYATYRLDAGAQTAHILGRVVGIYASTFSQVHWSVTRSRHFVVFHDPYEVQGSDAQYLADLEYERQQVERKFGVTLPPLTSYYLYPTTSLMGRLTRGACGATQDNVGCTNPYTRPPSIQTSLWPTYHEPIHVYQLALEPKPQGNTVLVAPLFIAEGMAVALEDREADPRLSDYCSTSTLVFVPLDTCARVAVDRTRTLDLLADRGFRRSDAGDAYALAGSFVKYLILTYGYHLFGTFYYRLAARPSDSITDYNAATYSVYHRSISQVLASWRSQLCAHGCG